MVDVVAIGEVMLELAGNRGQLIGSKMSLGVAGDTFNTAVYAARGGASVSYFTQLGDDPFSAEILEFIRASGVDTESISCIEGRVPGLYIIRNSDNGERSFHYWRSHSPAKEMFSTPQSIEGLKKVLSQTKIAYLSGVTLSIISAQATDELFEVLACFRATGGTVAFDSNYRPRLWPSVHKAREVIGRCMEICDVALLTDEDEQALWSLASMEEIASHYEQTTICELVIKRGPKNVSYFEREACDVKFDTVKSVSVFPVSNVIDTTGAGDSFNGAYLASRINNQSIEQAILAGSECAGRVIQVRGAIIPI